MATVVEVNGPFFDSRGHAAVDAMCDTITYEVAREGQAIVLARLATSIKVRTPYYETKIKLSDAGLFAQDVTDDGVIYGPWLEGVGSRNFPRTRFRGYSAFRNATQYLNAGVAEVIANRVAIPFVARMG